MLAYLRLLICNRLSALRPGNLAYGNGGGRNRQLRGFLYLLLYLFAFSSILFLVVMLERLLFGAFVQMGEPQTMLALLFMGCILVVIVTSFFFIFSSLFFGKDTQIVAAMPIPERGVLAARVIMATISEAVIATVVCIPAVIMYGTHIGADIGFYLRMLLFVPTLPLIPVSIVTLLSFLLIRVSALWKRREGVTVVMGFVLLGLFLYWEMSITSNIDDAEMTQYMMQVLTSQRQLIDGLVSIFPPIGWLTAAFSGQGWAAWGNGLLFAALGAAVMGLVIFVMGGHYQQLAIKQSETLAKLNNGKKRAYGKDTQSTPRKALFMAEMREVITTPIYAMNSFAGMIMFPILMLVGILSGSGSQGFGEITMMLEQLSPTLFVAVWTALLCFTCSMNMATFTAVSREGKRNYFSRIIPVSPQTQLQAKLGMGLLINGAMHILMSVIVLVVLPSMLLQVIISLIIATAFSILTSSLGLILDVRRPRYQWKNETEAIKQNINSLLTMLLTMVLIAAAALLYWLLTQSGVSMPISYTLAALLIVLGAVMAYRILMTSTAQRYYLQDFAN